MSRKPIGLAYGLNAIHFKKNLNKNNFYIKIKVIGAINFSDIVRNKRLRVWREYKTNWLASGNFR
jgi:hypothetical protein